MSCDDEEEKTGEKKDDDFISSLVVVETFFALSALVEAQDRSNDALSESFIDDSSF